MAHSVRMTHGAVEQPNSGGDWENELPARAHQNLLYG